MANGDEGEGAGGVINSVAGSAKHLTSVLDGLRGMLDALSGPFDNVAKATENFTRELGATGGFKNFKDLAFELDNLRIGLQKATGEGEKFKNLSMGISSELSGLAVTTDEAANAAQDLFSTYSRFSLISPKVQRQLVKQATAMERLGISSGTTAKNQEILIKAMSMTAEQAIATNEEIAALALEIGESPAKLASDFASSAPKLAKYGKAGVRVFKQLATQSKATGVEMGKLLGMTERFDTFEGAAQAAGNLNAILGGPLLNSVQLLTANEAERVDLIRRAVNATGRSFESMNRFEKQAIAQAAGIGDVADAVRLFGTEQAALDELEEKIDPSVEAQQNLVKAMKAGVSIAQRFEAAFKKLSEEIAEVLRPLLVDISIFLTGKKGLGAAKSIFKSLATNIKSVLGFLMKFKEPIQTISTLILKVGAFGFAVKQTQSLLDPVLGLISNPFIAIGLAIAVMHKNWDAISKTLSQGAKGIKAAFADLDSYVNGFFAKYEDDFPLLKVFKDIYQYIAKRIPDAIDFIAQKYNKFIAPLVSDFMNETGTFEGGFIATLDRLYQNDIKPFFTKLMETLSKMGRIITGIESFMIKFNLIEDQPWLKADAEKYKDAISEMAEKRNKRVTATPMQSDMINFGTPNMALQALREQRNEMYRPTNTKQGDVYLDGKKVGDVMTPHVVGNINNNYSIDNLSSGMSNE